MPPKRNYPYTNEIQFLLGSLIRHHRKQQNIKQTDLAMLAGLSAPALRNVERGTASLASLYKILSALDLRVECLPVNTGLAINVQLARLRKRIKLSQRDMARILCVSLPTIHMLEVHGTGSMPTLTRYLSLVGGSPRLVTGDNNDVIGAPKTAFDFVDLFAGIGGFHLALAQAGGVCRLAAEKDPHALATCQANFTGAYRIDTDIKDTELETMKSPDLLCAGFPCQPFSVAGRQDALLDPRGGLVGHLLRTIKECRPSVLLLENVKNLVSIDDQRVFTGIVNTLQGFGYSLKYKVLNTSAYVNIPQNRDRVFIVGFRDRPAANRFEFPEKIPLISIVSDYLEPHVPAKYYYEATNPIVAGISSTNKPTVYQWRRKYLRENKSGVCPALVANMGTGGHNVPIISDERGGRKLTPRECARLQGFPDWFLLPASDSHAYKQIGNSVCPKLVSRIVENILIARQRSI